MEFVFSILASSLAITSAQDANLYGIVAADDRISTFATAIGLAGLEDYFSNTSDLTVFAALFSDLDSLPPKFLTPGFLPHLVYLLEYHVIEGSVVPLSNITDRMVFTMKNGEDVTVAVTNQDVYQGVFFSGAAFENSKLLIWDGRATNGIRHVIGGYFLPERLTVDLITLAGSQEGFENMMQLIVASGLEEELKAENITILAPSNTAFESPPSDYLQNVAADTELLGNVLRYHVIVGSYPAAMITDGVEVMTTLGVPLKFAVVGGGRFADISAVGQANNATVERSDNFFANGISHTISAVLEPPTIDPTTPTTSTTPAPVEPTMPTASSPVATTTPSTPSAPTTPTPVSSTVPTTSSAQIPTIVPPAPVAPPTSSSSSTMFGGVMAVVISIAAALL